MINNSCNVWLAQGLDVNDVSVPVIGGHSGVTILPLLSKVGVIDHSMYLMIIIGNITERSPVQPVRPWLNEKAYFQKHISVKFFLGCYRWAKCLSATSTVAHNVHMNLWLCFVF